jgi:hypothetical protein
VDAELTPIPYETEEVSATPGLFASGGIPRLGALSFSAEEIRRAPGAAGDVSRIMMSLPSVAKVNDQSNGLIVRGGSPLENAFYVDNIEIPNINHFPVQGASSGPIGLINIDLVDNVHFSSGGFGASFGDRLSSVMELQFREGNRERFEAQLDLNITGFGGVAEGPLGSSGSWLLSLRRSYLDLIIDMVDIGTTAIPRYGDLQWKVVFDAGPANTLEFLGVWSEDRNNPDPDAAVENDMLYYGPERILQRTAGLGWRTLWTEGYSHTTLSVSSMTYRTEYHETGSNLLLLANHSDETSVALRNVNHWRISPAVALSFGCEAKLMASGFDLQYGAGTDPLGRQIPGSTVDSTLRRPLVGVFVSAELSPAPGLSTTLGLRADRSPTTGRLLLSPRIAAAVRMSETTTANAGLGLYYQSLPLLLHAQGAGGTLPSPRAFHAILGIEHLLTPGTRLTVEAYLKEYSRLPLDPARPSLFLLDELYYGYGFFTYHGSLEAGGRGHARGIELVIQKKLTEEIYGLASASYSTSRYLDDSGSWTARVCDNRIMVAFEGGYKPDGEWEFSGRWIFAGGCPYTPFDLARSAASRKGILDAQRINAERYPPYHSLNIRCDRRFHFTGSNLVCYLSVWNLYNRKNIAGYFWKPALNEQGTIYQWGLLPVFGIEYEF